MTGDTRVLLEALERVYKALRDIEVAIVGQTWGCGCGHLNGPALGLCGRCGRKPGEKV